MSAPRRDPLPFRGAYVDGRFAPSRRGEAFVSEDPGDLSRPVGTVRADPARVEEAVAAARRAFPAWRARSLRERTAALRRYRVELTRRREEIAWLISRETGKPWAESRAEVRAMAEKVDVTVREAFPLVAPRSFPLEGGASGTILYRPLGVVAVLGPFNVPGHLPNGQIVPALLAGDTVVFKPSELTPFTGQAMAGCFRAAGLPRGVVNVVPGGGAAGSRLAAHADVDAVFFTGSAATGARVRAAVAHQPGKLLALEMGGKNAALVLHDADTVCAAREIVHGAFATSGQRCSSTSRVFVHRSVAKRFLTDFLARFDALRVGYFLDEPSLGPLVRAGAVAAFLRAQRTASRLGFETLREGKTLARSREGHYVRPSVHLWTGPFPFDRWARGGSRAYWDEELFAPDVAVYVVASEEEAVAGNNASRYGLAASVFTASGARFRRLRDVLENGVVHWNRGTAMTPGRLPFGGLKASGNHRPAGLFASYACTRVVGSVEQKTVKGLK